MSLQIKSLTLGPFATNAYLVADTETNTAILIDPVDDAPAILGAAKDEGWAIKLMLATHAHLDHVLASAAIQEELRIPFLIHADCEALLDEIPLQGMYFGLGQLPEPAKPDRLLHDNELIELDSIGLTSLYTPGHAPGHLSFFLARHKILFSGDSLFAGSIGRTDLPGGDHDLLMNSIMTRLMTLDDDVRVLPGHMGATTIGRERLTNPFILSYSP
ncbi:MAG: MBL fold metallo-hydrolase [Chloroflexi bacterium]|nr:MBL fold metallo-hydrolase [Chloroflexota bacterium]